MKVLKEKPWWMKSFLRMAALFFCCVVGSSASAVENSTGSNDSGKTRQDSLTPLPLFIAHDSLAGLHGPDSVQIPKPVKADSFKTTTGGDSVSRFVRNVPEFSEIQDTGYFFSETRAGTIFSREQILRADAATLPELLRLLPGFSVQRNRFFAGAEEVRWCGLRMTGIALTMDGVPFSSQDLCWQAIPRWSAASFRRVRVSSEAEKYGGRHLVVELESCNDRNTPPLTDVMYETGPFETSLLDILFARKLSPAIDFLVHSRKLSVGSRNYSHPDVITTFYESMGKDSSASVYKGFNPMQEASELRLGVSVDLRRFGKAFGFYSSMQETDTLFSRDTGLVAYGWKTRSIENGFISCGIRDASLASGWTSLSFYQRQNTKGFRLSDRFSLRKNIFELGLEKRLNESDVLYASPLFLWLQSRQNLHPVGFSTLLGVTQCRNPNGILYSAREQADFMYRFLFLHSWIAYGLALPLQEATYGGIPAVFVNPSPDTLLEFGAKLGLRHRGYCLWSQVAGKTETMPGLVLRGREEPLAGRSVAVGFYTYGMQGLQCGSTSAFTDSLFQENLWVLFAAQAMGRRLHYEAFFGADYFSRQTVMDLKKRNWIETEPFWDLSLKLAFQIRSFRLFYHINNLLNQQRMFYSPYPLPGLNFLWGIRWGMQG